MTKGLSYVLLAAPQLDSIQQIIKSLKKEAKTLFESNGTVGKG